MTAISALKPKAGASYLGHRTIDRMISKWFSFISLSINLALSQSVNLTKMALEILGIIAGVGNRFDSQVCPIVNVPETPYIYWFGNWHNISHENYVDFMAGSAWMLRRDGKSGEPAVLF